MSPRATVLGRLVRAVADPTSTAIEVGPANDNRGFISIDDAVAIAAAGGCVAVTTRPDILALDLDTRGDGIDEAVFDDITSEIRTLGLTPVVIASGQPGHKHLFARGLPTRTRDRLTSLARAVGIDVREGHALIRPPGVQHRTGVEASLLNLDNWETALDALTTDSPSPITPATRERPRPPRRRPPEGKLEQLLDGFDQRLRQLIIHGDTELRYDNNGSRLTMAICNHAANTGVSLEQLRTVLAHPSARGGQAYRKRLRRRALHWTGDRWLEHTWSKAVGTRWTRAPIRTRADARATILELQDLASQWVFTGRTSTTDRAVLAAMHNIALRRGGPVVPMSVRELAEEAGMAIGTVCKARNRLRAQGWVRLTRCSRGDRASIWACTDPRETDTRSAPGRGGVGLCQERANLADPIPISAASHDAWAHGALGKTGLAVLDAIGSGLTSPKAIARRLDRNPGTIRRHLYRLRDAGLIAGGGGAWRLAANPAEVLEEVAEAKGTAGRNAARRDRHARERLHYKEHLERLRELALLEGRVVRRIDSLRHRRDQRVLTPPPQLPLIAVGGST